MAAKKKDVPEQPALPTAPKWAPSVGAGFCQYGHRCDRDRIHAALRDWREMQAGTIVPPYGTDKAIERAPEA